MVSHPCCKVVRRKVIYLLHKTAVLSENGVDQGRVLRPVAVSNIVDADPHAEERVVALPDLAGGGRPVLRHEFILDLLLQRDHGVGVRLDQGAINSGTAVGKVVGLEKRSVVLVCEVANPVGATGGGIVSVLWHCIRSWGGAYLEDVQPLLFN